ACGLNTFACSPPPGSTFPVGATLVTCIATGTHGESNSCTFTVRVVDSRGLCLSTAAMPSGTVCRNPDRATYALNDAVSLTASPTPGWAFSGWSGDASGANNPLRITMTTDKTITANFTSTIPDIILDNTAATFTGSWSTGTGNACYGPDYRYI